MLVLSRQRNESVVIKVGNVHIEITVVDIRGDKCRLGFEADRSIIIDRKEVYERKKYEGDKRRIKEEQNESVELCGPEREEVRSTSGVEEIHKGFDG